MSRKDESSGLGPEGHRIKIIPFFFVHDYTKLSLTPRSTHSQILRAPLPSSPSLASLPFTPTGTKLETHYTSTNPTGEINRFKVRAGQSLQEWEKAGWIWAGDPRGWAEWYCRFWGGRRCGDDERQVRRCRSFLLVPLLLGPIRDLALAPSLSTYSPSAR